MDSSSEEEVAIISCLLAEEEEQQRRNRKRKIWIHRINQKRMDYGEYNKLFPDLIEDEAKSFKYFHMSQDIISMHKTEIKVVPC
jgi:ribosomal protein L20